MYTVYILEPGTECCVSVHAAPLTLITSSVPLAWAFTKRDLPNTLEWFSLTLPPYLTLCLASQPEHGIIATLPCTRLF